MTQARLLPARRIVSVIDWFTHCAFWFGIGWFITDIWGFPTGLESWIGFFLLVLCVGAVLAWTLIPVRSWFRRWVWRRLGAS